MQTPFLGNVILFGGNFAPVGWALCDGSLLDISQNSALFSLLGTTYGGDGVNTFGVPDLRGRIPVHQGQGGGLSNYVMGQTGGTEAVSLIAPMMPLHSHPVFCNSGAATTTDPTGGFLAAQTSLNEYVPGASANAVMRANAVGNSPGGLPHNNIMPSLALNYIIATEGIYPPQN
jgi:microcystin-dependent protein